MSDSPSRGRLSAILGAAAISAVLILSSGGCTEVPLRTQGVGDTCASTDECVIGLNCVENICQPAGDVAENNPCKLTAECDEGLYCTLTGLCAPAGVGVLGDVCTTSGDCEKGLFCDYIAFAGTCAEGGSGGNGAECSGTGDCLSGLTCQEGLCGFAVGQFLPVFAGVECAAEDPQEPFKVYFELPDGDGGTTDFFRHPFPSDLRLTHADGGRPDLATFPRPGAGLLGFDPVARFVDAIEADLDGWGINPVIYFRFSKTPNVDGTASPAGNTLTYQEIISQSVRLFDLDDPSGSEMSRRWVFSPSANAYVCDNWIAVQPNGGWGDPLTPGHRYAAVILNDIQDEGGNILQADGAFSALWNSAIMDSANKPSDPKVLEAYELYKPLWDALGDPRRQVSSIDRTKIVAATVFTVQSDVSHVGRIASAVESGHTPSMSGLVLCGGAATNCGECDDTSSVYSEVHGTVNLPVFQSGARPYLDPEQGGAASNTIQTTEDVCFSLTVPKGTPPAGGWPVVIYAHGTGGSFRSHVANGMAANLGSVSGTPSGMAVIGWEQVMHGTRRGETTVDPDTLFFNFANPKAARGNVLQSAADGLAMADAVRNLAQTGLSGLVSGVADLNPAEIYFMGHSQGSIAGPLFVPQADEISSAVLSGAGGSISLSLVNKTSPVNLRPVISFVLGESATGFVSDMHPVISLIQTYMDSVDGISYGPGWFGSGAARPPHLLLVKGAGDTWTPNVTTDALALSLDLSSATPKQVFGFDGGSAAAFWNDYVPDSGKDGHFVLFDLASARGDAADFLAESWDGGTPSTSR